MRVIGFVSPVGPPLVDFVVGHGEHPDETLWRAGYVPVRPLSAGRTDDVTVSFLIRQHNQADRPPQSRTRQQDPGIDPNEPITLRQRIAAYAVVSSRLGLLGTVCSARTNAAGVWMLPGGGLNDGESPAAAVVREVYEETGQKVRLDRLLTLQSDHWIGRAPDGRLEDFHALRLIYSATCDAPEDPVVHDTSGTTESAAWVPRGKWRALPWTAGARSLLAKQISTTW